jgi:hypothetical protein
MIFLFPLLMGRVDQLTYASLTGLMMGTMWRLCGAERNNTFGNNVLKELLRGPYWAATHLAEGEYYAVLQNILIH